jgi:hypothetical protein
MKPTRRLCNGDRVLRIRPKKQLTIYHNRLLAARYDLRPKTVRDTQPTNCTIFCFRYLYYNLTLNIATCFDSEGIIRETNQSDTAKKNKIRHFYTHQISHCYIHWCIKVATLVFCRNTLVWYPDDDTLRIETCGNIQYEISCILLVDCC